MTTTNKKFHFISGLPRSGSTLLSSILNQNPRFSASISDSLISFTKSYINIANSDGGVKSMVSEEKLKDLIIDMFHSYYKNDNEVCFNTNRSWTSEIPLIKSLFPDFKMIVCMRHIPWILDSFEVLERKDPYTLKPLYGNMNLSNVYQRSHMLMGNIPDTGGGVVSDPLLNLKHLVHSEDRHSVLYLDYDALVQHPKEVMKIVYNYLEEDYFEHDFNSVGAKYEKYDEGVKIKDLHTVRDSVGFNKRKTILPTDLWNMYAEYSFWKTNPEIMADLKYVYTEDAPEVESKQEIAYESSEPVSGSNVAGFIPKYYKGD